MAKEPFFARDEQGVLQKKFFEDALDGKRWQKDMRARRSAYRHGKPLPNFSRLTLGEWFTAWLRKLDATISTKDDYARKMRLHVLRYFNDKPVAELHQMHFEQLLDYIVIHHNLDPATRNRVRAILHKLYRDAVKARIVAVNPISAIEQKKENPSKVHVLWTEGQCFQYLEAAKAWRWEFFVFLHLMIHLGDRKGENIALQWKHDLRDQGVMVIRQTLEQVTGQIVERTKSDGQKKITKVKYAGVPAALRQILDEHRAKTPFSGPDDFIVADAKGLPMKPRRACTLHDRLVARLGFKHCRLHDFRHMHGTYLLRKTGDLYAVKEQLGHTSIQTTERYVHLDAEDAAKRMKSFALTEPKPQVPDTFSDTITGADTLVHTEGA